MYWYTLEGKKKITEILFNFFILFFRLPIFHLLWSCVGKHICSPCRAHTEPLMFANRSMSLSNINVYMTCIIVYQCLDGCAPDIFNDFYTGNRNVHDHETRQACDLHVYVPYGRLDMRRNSMKIHGANMWNSIPENIKKSESINYFKQRLRNSLGSAESPNIDFCF